MRLMVKEANYGIVLFVLDKNNMPVFSLDDRRQFFINNKYHSNKDTDLVICRVFVPYAESKNQLLELQKYCYLNRLEIAERYIIGKLCA